MVGLALVAVLAVSALAAGSATAATKCKANQHEYVNKEGERTCESVAEHAQWQSMANCPFHEPPISSEYHELQGCVWAELTAKEKFSSKAERESLEAAGRTDLPSEFTAGKVTVKLAQPIILKGGFEENEENGQLQWFGARGAPTIEPVAQAAPPLNKDVDTSKLSASELERYTYYVKTAKQVKATATVELAGPATDLVLNETNLLLEEGTAFAFPVKVKLSNPFVGDSCYVGSDEHPIFVEFTTGTSGALRGKEGSISFNPSGSLLTVSNDTMVSTTFAAPGVEGCGIEGGADAALNSALGLPSASGNSAVIDGTFRQASAHIAEEALRGEL